MSKLTRKDVLKYIIKIKLNFENAFNDNTDVEQQLLIESWYDILWRYPKEICDAAMNNAIAKAKFAPRIGDITEEIDKILFINNSKTDIELWAELMDVKREVFDASLYLRYPQHFEEAQAKLKKIYDDLSEELKLYIVNVSSLVEICTLNEEYLPYEKSQFFRKMPELRKHFNEKMQATQLLETLDKKLIGNNESNKKKDG